MAIDSNISFSNYDDLVVGQLIPFDVMISRRGLQSKCAEQFHAFVSGKQRGPAW
jgi:hypothetical protein